MKMSIRHIKIFVQIFFPRKKKHLHDNFNMTSGHLHVKKFKTSYLYYTIIKGAFVFLPLFSIAIVILPLIFKLCDFTLTFLK